MRAVTVCALAALCAVYASAEPEFVRDFEAFKTKYNKKYASAAEEADRFKAFVGNMRAARELQAVNPHAKFGANVFADMTPEEFKRTHHNAESAYAKARRVRLPTMHFSAEEKAAAAGKQDWRPKGAVTPVKNQGQCGSCWSFSTTGGIEGQWFLAGNKLTSLSEQELVSCDTIDHGCDGGLMDNAFNWLLQTHNGSIVTEASYPYVSGDGIVPACDMTGKEFGARIESFNNVAEADMTAFVSDKGPLSIAVDAESWQTYQGGIMTNCAAGQLDHGVLIVGYDDESTPKYWIIKNSWAASWGEEGYIRVEKGTGQCSIGQYQTSSVVKSGPSPNPTPAPAGPSPSGGEFTQKTCKDARCTKCEEQKFPQNSCIVRDGASYKAVCDTNSLIVQEYASKDCSGAYRTQSQPTDVCAIVFGAFDAVEFVQASCSATPSPPSPPGPNPPAPTPAPATKTFVQKQCSDSACTQGCQSHTFPQNQCLSLTGGGSAKAVCTSMDLQMTIYPLSTDCSGASETQQQPINQCVQDESGTYLENICGSSSAVQKAVEMSGLKAVRKH